MKRDEGPWRSAEAFVRERQGGSDAAEPPPTDALPPNDEGLRKIVVAAYGLLARRAYTRHEMRQKLRRGFADAEESIERAVDWLVGKRLIDDARLAHDAARAAAMRRGWGRHKIVAWLLGRGIDRDLAAQAAGSVSIEDEAGQAAALARRQLDRGKRPDQVYRFLISRGFSSDLARAAARNRASEDLPDPD